MSDQSKTNEGRQAYLDGKELRHCPYPETSVDAVEWEGGWMEAEEEACDD